MNPIPVTVVFIHGARAEHVHTVQAALAADDDPEALTAAILDAQRTVGDPWSFLCAIDPPTGALLATAATVADRLVEGAAAHGA